MTIIEGHVLLPMAKYAGEDFRWIDTFTAESSNFKETCYIMAFNASNKQEIPQILHKVLDRYNRIENPNSNQKADMKVLKEITNEIGVTGFDHPIQKELLAAINQKYRLNLTGDDVYYLSGVIHIDK